MILRAPLLTLLCAAVVSGREPPPIIITGGEQQRIDLSLPDGGLPACPGVANVQVHRAAAGWTYNHHVDMGCWKGRLYLAWDSCAKDEDVGESRELYATSDDGVRWSEPKELFPQGLSTHLRMFFFHAPNGRMLALAGLRTSNEPLNERKKGPLIVREIAADHSLGAVHLLRPPGQPTTRSLPPAFDASPDEGFAQACQQLLANKPFLEQSDYGMLLGERRMKWHDVNAWPAEEPSRAEFDRFGKAMQFFHRKDGALVAVMKWGWVMVSRDEGETWSPPLRPPTFVCGMAKAWGQRTADGRYALAYNPDLLKRYPLVLVSGDDGITFGDMRVVHGELPPIRYPGLHKAEGPQYVRGISEWSGDGSRGDGSRGDGSRGDGSRGDEQAMWLAYSVGKEDIWVSRVPLPVNADPDAWNTYSPRWAPAVATTTRQREGSTTIVLEDRDPADYARAFRALGGVKQLGVKQLDVSFSLEVESPPGGRLLMQLEGPRGRRALTLPFEGRVARIRVTADCVRNQYSLWDDDRHVVNAAPLAQPVERFDRILFTSGERPASHAPAQDRPLEPARFRLTDVRLSTPP